MSSSLPTRSIGALIEVLLPEGAATDPSEVRLERNASPEAASRLAAALAAGGIGWVTVPPGRRRHARRNLAAAGLHVAGSWLALPARRPRSLVPLVPVSSHVRAALSASLQGLGAWQTAMRWSGRMLEELAPGVGLLVQPAGSGPPLAWLASAGVSGPVVISAGWHDPVEGVTLLGERAVVKSTRVAARRDPGAEAALLRELGPDARAAGAQVPSVLFAGPAGGRLALVEDVLSGRRASTVLRKEPQRLAAVLGELGDWLAAWQIATRRVRELTEADVEQWLLEPARSVASLLPAGGAYLERLAALGRAQVGVAVPFAAAHNDLTTWNVLVDGTKLSVVDWEAAEAEALPLVDLEYAIVDAVSVARRRSREAAFVRCSDGGPDSALTRDLLETIRGRVEVSEGAAELARHACWLGHARNEARASDGTGQRPFLTILRRLAAA